MPIPYVQCIETPQGKVFVIDAALEEESLTQIDDFRSSLSLDSKRPTVDRRFFADGPRAAVVTTTRDLQRPIASLIELALEDSLEKIIGRVDVHVFRYQRFLEYSKAGSSLSPHTDGTKVCDDTQKRSTHTLLLYLNDCVEGGETLLLSHCGPGARVLHATQPIRGRILVFPHDTPHAGATVVSLPKICLRAEVAIREGG